MFIIYAYIQINRLNNSTDLFSLKIHIPPLPSPFLVLQIIASTSCLILITFISLGNISIMLFQIFHLQALLVDMTQDIIALWQYQLSSHCLSHMPISQAQQYVKHVIILKIFFQYLLRQTMQMPFITEPCDRSMIAFFPPCSIFCFPQLLAVLIFLFSQFCIYTCYFNSRLFPSCLNFPSVIKHFRYFISFVSLKVFWSLKTCSGLECLFIGQMISCAIGV